MKKTQCLTMVTGQAMRLTQVDACGRPVFGEESQAVSDGFISVALTVNTTESDAIQVTNAAGKICVNRPAKTSFANYSVEMVFCGVDPGLFALATGQRPYEDSDGNVIGFTVSTKPQRQATVGLEVWMGSEGGDACDDPDAEGEFGYLNLPFLDGGVVGDFTIENGAVNFTITGSVTKDGTRWGVGPYNVVLEGGVPAVLPNALETNDHLLMITTQVAPPEAVCGARPLLDPSVASLTAVTGTTAPASLNVSFAVTPSTAGLPVWYDFGDGTWDYIEGSLNGVTTHLYAGAGTYTVKASTNGVWKTTTVTVPGA